MKRHSKRALILSIHHWFKHISRTTSSSNKKSKYVSITLILTKVMSILVEATTWANCGRNSSSSNLFGTKSIFCCFKIVFKLQVCKQMHFLFWFIDLLFLGVHIWTPGKLRVTRGLNIIVTGEKSLSRFNLFAQKFGFWLNPYQCKLQIINLYRYIGWHCWWFSKSQKVYTKKMSFESHFYY